MAKILFIGLIFFASAAASQQSSLPGKELIPLPKDKVDWSTQMTFTDHMGRPFRRAYVDVKGSPFYFDEWKTANARNTNGTLAGIAKIKIDIYNGEIDCLRADNDSMILQEGVITEFTLLDSALTGRNYLFRSGFPAVDKNNTNTFYLVLSDGPAQLLKASKKVLAVDKNEMSGEISKEFILYEDLYIFRTGTILRLKKDKEFVLGQLSDQRAKLDDYLKDKKLNFKNAGDLANLFTYYNSLFKAF